MEIKEGRITLRKLAISDVPRLAEIANSEKIAMNLRDGFPHPYTEKDAINFIENVCSKEGLFVFGIEHNAEYCGNISLSIGTDVYRRSAEIGYFIGEEYWGRGIVSQAVKMICKFGFDELKINRIHTGVYEYNQASMKVLEKCGFQKEGIFRKSVFKNNQFWDEYRYALIND